MRTIKSISKKEIINLLNKCWMTHDGMWFYHCLQEFGIETTNKINKSAIQSLAAIEIKRLINLLGIDQEIKSFEEFRTFFEEASELMIPDFMNGKFAFPRENVMTWEFAQGKCFAYTGIKNLGEIEKYECGVLYRIKCWLDALGINHQFNPEIDTCHMHYNGSCSGEIQLSF